MVSSQQQEFFLPSFIRQYPDFYRAIVAQILAQREPITTEQQAVVDEINNILNAEVVS